MLGPHPSGGGRCGFQESEFSGGVLKPPATFRTTHVFFNRFSGIFTFPQPFRLFYSSNFPQLPQQHKSAFLQRELPVVAKIKNRRNTKVYAACRKVSITIISGRRRNCRKNRSGRIAKLRNSQNFHKLPIFTGGRISNGRRIRKWPKIAENW